MPKSSNAIERNSLHAHIHHSQQIEQHQQDIIQDFQSQLQISKKMELWLRSKIDSLNTGWSNSVKQQNQLIEKHDQFVTNLKNQYQQALDKLQMHYDTLLDDYNKLKSELHISSSNKDKEHKQQISNLTEQNRKDIANVNAQNVKQISNLKAKYEQSLHHQRAKHQKAITTLREKNKQLTTSLQTAQKAVEEQQRHANTLSQEIDHLKSNGVTSKSPSTKHQKQTEDLQNQLQSLNEEITQLKLKIVAAETERDLTANRHDQILKNLNDVTKDRDIWRDRAESGHNDIVLERPYSPTNGELMSPAPLQQMIREDATSESRSRFTDHLPFSLDDSSDEEEEQAATNGQEVTDDNRPDNSPNPANKLPTRSSRSTKDTTQETDSVNGTVLMKKISTSVAPNRRPRTRSANSSPTSAITNAKAVNTRAQTSRSNGTTPSKPNKNRAGTVRDLDKNKRNTTKNTVVKSPSRRSTRSNENVKPESPTKSKMEEPARVTRRSSRRKKDVSYDYDRDGRDISNYGLDHMTTRSKRTNVVAKLNFGSDSRNDVEIDGDKQTRKSPRIKRKPEESSITKHKSPSKRRKV